jgi:hypothetical protein
MSTAWSGIAFVAKYLYLDADHYGAEFPWGREHFLDPRTPGGYAFGSKTVGGYYRELLKRLDGDPSADGVVIGTYPDDAYPMVTLDSTRPDGRIVIFFGHGIDRTSIDGTTVVVRDDVGSTVPVTIDVFRGDQWANVLTIRPESPWLPSMQYSATLSKTIRTLHGTSPSQDFELAFLTCTPRAAGGDCDETVGPPPPSPCPALDARYAARPDDPDAGPVEDPDAGPAPAIAPASASDSGGCALPTGTAGHSSLVALGLLLGALHARRRRRHDAPLRR